MASIGLPATGGFIGEFLSLVGAFQVNSWVAFLATTSLVLGAAYMLWLYRRIIYGKITREELKTILDLKPREILVFAPLVVLVFWMGIYPSSFLGPMNASVANLIEQYETAVSASVPVAPRTSVAER
jgi:NADH-quinone oxidoreductase subunit M